MSLRSAICLIALTCILLFSLFITPVEAQISKNDTISLKTSLKGFRDGEGMTFKKKAVRTFYRDAGNYLNILNESFQKWPQSLHEVFFDSCQIITSSADETGWRMSEYKGKHRLDKARFRGCSIRDHHFLWGLEVDSFTLEIENSEIYSARFSYYWDEDYFDLPKYKRNFRLEGIHTGDWYSKHNSGFFRMVNSKLLSDSSSDIDIHKSYLTDLIINGNTLSGSRMLFLEDSIYGSVDISGNQFSPNRRDSSKLAPLTIAFSNCFIDCPIKIVGNSSFAVNVIFEDVRFGPNVGKMDLEVDSLTFYNCRNMKGDISLSRANFVRQTFLSLPRSDVDHLRFDYFGGFRLYDSPYYGAEGISSQYETLLANYEKNHQVASFRNLDIEYKRYKNSNIIFWGDVLSAIQSAWWNFGYSKNLIIIWILVAILLFFLLNILIWRKIIQVYHIPEIHYDGRQKGKLRFNKYISIFLYTCFIFFSFGIKFERLKYYNSLYLFLFFFQYLTGILCLFFAVNAILH